MVVERTFDEVVDGHGSGGWLKLKCVVNAI